MEFWLLVRIFYAVLVAFTFAFVSYYVVKSGLNDRHSVPVMVSAIVLLSVFWPGTWLGMLFEKGKKDHKEDDESGHY